MVHSKSVVLRSKNLLCDKATSALNIGQRRRRIRHSHSRQQVGVPHLSQMVVAQPQSSLVHNDVRIRRVQRTPGKSTAKPTQWSEYVRSMVSQMKVATQFVTLDRALIELCLVTCRSFFCVLSSCEKRSTRSGKNNLTCTQHTDFTKTRPHQPRNINIDGGIH
jgi:hypothetical protein